MVRTMKIPQLRAALIAVAILLPAAAVAQFRTTASLVVAPITVTDSAGKLVESVDPASLVLYDNGKRQAIQVEENYAPISLVVAIQTSSHAAPVLEKLASSGILFSNLIAGDDGETALLTYSDEIRTLKDFSADSDALSAGLRSLHVQADESATLDAVIHSLAVLSKRKSGRRPVLLMIGENRDRSSKATWEVVLREAQRQNVEIYWLTFSRVAEELTAKQKQVVSRDPKKDGQPLPPETPPGNLLSVFTELAQKDKADAATELTRATGGRTFAFVEQEALEDAIMAVGAEIHAQYLATFPPKASHTPEYHTLRAEISGHPEWTVRTRAGYWPAR
jgi:VWFA-related protein